MVKNILDIMNQFIQANFINLIFEGEFLNGNKWNGKGMEYDDTGYLIKVIYLNGKKIL